MGFSTVHFSATVKHITDKSRGIVQEDYHVTLDGEDCAGVLFDDGTAVVHAYGCHGPVSEVTPDCYYWSSFYILPSICQDHSQLRDNVTCARCGRRKGKEWQQYA